MTFQSGNMLRLLPDVFHVLRTCSHVFRCNIFALEAVYQASVSAEDSFPILSFRITNDDSFAAAKWQSGERILIRHASGKAKSILNRFSFSGIIPKAGSS